MSETETIQDSTVNKDVAKPTEWADKQKWEAETSLRLRKEYETLFELWKQGEFSELEKKNEQTIQEGLVKLFEKYKEEQKPITDDELQKLLDQEYKTFKIKVEYVDGDDDKSEMCVIRELPQSSEKKFFKQFKDTILAKASELEALTQASVDQPFEVKVKAFLELFGESFDTLAEAVVICLNPFGKNKYITVEWVQNNISSDRQLRIIEAQVEVNRLKDFFLRISQSGQRTQTILTGQRFQQLQQLVR